jgi:integrase
MTKDKRQFGNIRRLPSKRYQAFYRHDGDQRHTAGSTFETRLDAEAWLLGERRLIASGDWTPPRAREAAKHSPASLFGTYADAWVEGRTLKPRTRAHYRALLRDRVKPTFQDQQVKAITPAAVRVWYAALGAGQPTMRSHAYGLLRSILTTAVHDGLLPSNPCHIRGAGNVKRKVKIEPATLSELEALVAAMPSTKYKVMVLTAAWCALRFGEQTELRRKDIDLTRGVIRVRRGVARADGAVVVGTPKSEAGIRDVAIPPHLIPVLRDYLSKDITGGREGLIFPAADGYSHIAPSTLYRVFYRARATAGRPDLRWHDLRHTGAVLAASTGATLAELMGRLGHSTPGAALRYQHASQGRDQAIAKALSALVSGG